ncbi:hypothetical protein [Actinophytocola sp.]|uniref:hypothetical protein n=1 Tax=Actinophytocola sp. TaxID=1872138 RepID=UPI003D6A283E
MRLLPYVDGLVLALLRGALPSTVTVETELSDPLRRTPYVFVDLVGGEEVDPRFLGVPRVDVDCFTSTGGKQAAADLAEHVRVVLFRAWEDQKVTPHGHLASFRTLTYPHEIRTAGQPGEVYRFTAAYELGVRPPRSI